MNQHSLELDFSEHDSLSIGILSDTHGELDANVADFIKQCDIALHAGDIMAAKCLTDLKPKLGITLAVKGNNDLPSVWDANDHEMLDEIPDQVELNLPGGKLVMEHSHRHWDKDVTKIHANLRQAHPDAQLVVYGHTHIRVMDQKSNPPLLNPGAAGPVRNHGGPSCAKLIVNSKQWKLTKHRFNED